MGIVLGGVLSLGAVWHYLTAPKLNAAERGYRHYNQLGCSGCHGAGGTGGISNPRSNEHEVPGFIGGTSMMYVESLAEVREWVLEGRPKRLTQPLSGDRAMITMPAYRGKLRNDELDDLVAYYQAASWYEPTMPKLAQEGRRAAHRLGCFGCHGASGRVGAANPGSLKGYIPGWGSHDYFELVRSDEELRAWILDGKTPRLSANRVAQYFTERQLIKMPAYRSVISPTDLDVITRYIKWITRNHKL